LDRHRSMVQWTAVSTNGLFTGWTSLALSTSLRAGCDADFDGSSLGDNLAIFTTPHGFSDATDGELCAFAGRWSGCADVCGTTVADEQLGLCHGILLGIVCEFSIAAADGTALYDGIDGMGELCTAHVAFAR
jgi:hypothetical protein